MSSSHKYSPVGGATSAAAEAASLQDNDKNSCSRLLLVAPLFHFFIDPLTELIPASLLSCLVKSATIWRRLMAKRACSWTPLLSDITVAHLLLCIPLSLWLVRATHLAFLDNTSHHSLKHSGKMTSYAMAGAFFTAIKSHNLISLVTGLSFDRLVNFHLASAVLTLWMGCLHGIQIAYYHRGDNKEHHHHDEEEDDEEHHHSHDEEEEEHHHHNHDEEEEDHDGHHRMLHHDSDHAYLGSDPNLWKFFLDGGRNTSGSLVLAALFLLVITSVFHKLFRKWWFEGWLIYHITGATIVLVAGMVHGADIFIFVIIWWTIDLLIRYGVMVGALYPRQAKLTRVTENVTKIQWTKTNTFNYEAGQFVQIAIPSVRMWEFHPLSIASSPEEPQITLFVRALPGTKTWTRRLYETWTDEQKISTTTLRVFLEGPYGSIPPILDDSCSQQYSMAVLISGGIGVTPCHSVAKRLLSKPTPTLKKIWYIWSVRNEDMVQAIPPPTLSKNADGATRSNSSDDNGIELVERGLDADEKKSEADAGDDDADNDDTLHEVGPMQHSLSLQTDIYISQMGKFVENGEDDVDDEADGIGNAPNKTLEADDSAKQCTIHRGGRPDIQAILKKVHAEALREGWGRIFVMGCGPVSLLDALEVACQTNQTKEVQIDFHQEVFDY